MAKEKKIKSDKIDSPHPYLIQEAEDLEKAQQETTNLQNELTEQIGKYEDLKAQIDAGLKADERLKIAKEIAEDEKVRGLQDRINVLEYQMEQLRQRNFKLEERARLLQIQRMETMDKYELDEEWKKKAAKLKVLEREISETENKLNLMMMAREEEVKDLNQIREQYNIMVDNYKNIEELIRKAKKEYNVVRKKATDALPPLFQPLEPPKPKGNFIKRGIIKLLRRS